MFSSATQPPHGPPPPRHNFVSAITFEGFKLRSSNLTHALLIQISRTSSIIDIVVPSKMAAGGHFVKKKKKLLRIDLKWPEMRSKVICGHPKWPPAAILSKILKKKINVPYGSEMARNAIESEFRTSKMADQSEMARNAIQSDFQTSKMAAGKKKILYRSEMARIAIESEFRKSKMADRSEMARNAIESEFQTSKMAAGSHFVKNFKKLKLHIDLKWPEMRSKVNFGHPKWPTSAILSKISKKIKVAYRSEMARNAIESEIRTSKMADVSHFVKNF